MSTSAPIPLIQNGLVFCYDTSNVKSFRGEPTTNQYTNSDFTNGTTGWTFNSWDFGNYSYTTTNTIGPFGENTKALLITKTGSTTYADFHQENGGKYSSGNTYTLSAYVKGSGSLVGTYQGGFSGSTITLTLDPATWKRINYTVSSSTNTNYPYWSAANVSYLYFAYAQSELKNHATQWTVSSRSNTDGLLDLNRTYTLNLSSAGFDSGANLVFNGSSNFINANTIPDSFWNSSSWTASAWVNFTAVSKSIDNAIFSHGAIGTNNGLHLGERNSKVYFGFYGNDTIGNYTLAANTWYNIVYVFNYSTKLKQIYVNGAFDTSGGSIGYSGTGSNTEFGRYPYATSYLLYGSLPIVNLYNRVLTASEILQIYNSTKSRFGL